MTTTANHNADRLTRAYTATDADTRLRATLAAGTDPQPGDLRALIVQCAVEPDFFVRDMLTWALTRHPVDTVLPLLLTELRSPVPRAVSQSLHTLSKIGDARAFPHVTDAHLRSTNDEIARTAWRTAAGLATPADRPGLATRLAGQLGRSDREMRRSLSRAFLQLGESARATLEDHGGVHARATLLMLDDPELGFDAAEHAAAADTTGAAGEAGATDTADVRE